MYWCLGIEKVQTTYTGSTNAVLGVIAQALEIIAAVQVATRSMAWVVFKGHFAFSRLNATYTTGSSAARLRLSRNGMLNPEPWEIVKIILIHRGLTIYRLCPRHRWED